MKISTQTEWFVRDFGLERGIELLAKAGFDAIDFTLFVNGGEILFDDEDALVEKFTKIRKKVDECGLYVNQTHAPFPSANGDSEHDAKKAVLLEKALHVSSILGAKQVIVHPQILRENRYGSLSEENKKLNVELYSKLIPALYKYDIKIAIENMFNYDPAIGKICPTCCSSSTELADYVDTMNALCEGGDRFVACLDIGHTVLSGEAPIGKMIGNLGSRLKSLHIHDNDGKNDLHTAPGFGGKVDFEGFAKGLLDIGYDGEFTFEADSFYRNLDSSMLFDGGCMLCKIGRTICERYGL